MPPPTTATLIGFLLEDSIAGGSAIEVVVVSVLVVLEVESVVVVMTVEVIWDRDISFVIVVVQRRVRSSSWYAACVGVDVLGVVVSVEEGRSSSFSCPYILTNGSPELCAWCVPSAFCAIFMHLGQRRQ